MTAPTTPPHAVLTMADYFGTLAAARSLGRAGVGVVLADAHTLTTTRWSRHVARALQCPDPEAQPGRFLDWLAAFGARDPGHVLYATSDELAWLLAANREDLGRDFRMYTPPLEAMYTLLNKWRLYGECAALGIDAPETWLATSEEAVERLGRGVPLPLVIKPQTQAFLSPHQKGRIVRRREALVPLYREFLHATRYASIVVEHDPGVRAPVVQAFSDGAAQGIYSLSGFVDETGDQFVVEASRKVMQWPTRLGVGLCFEQAPVVPEVASDLQRLCRHVGYYGAFEVEYLESGGRHLLIDFNPRFYGQMAFEVARGLDVPLLVYSAAIGAQKDVKRCVENARKCAVVNGGVYCNRVELEIALRLLSLAGRIDARDQRRWHEWLEAHRGALTDAVLDRDDWLPAVAEVTAALLRCAIHPRSTWRAARTG